MAEGGRIPSLVVYEPQGTTELPNHVLGGLQGGGVHGSAEDQIPRPAIDLVEEAEEKGSGVDGPIVGPVWRDAGPRQFAPVELVEDLAGFSRAEGIGSLGHPVAQGLEDVPAQLGIEVYCLESGNEAVPAEERAVPRQTRCRDHRPVDSDE